MLTSIQMGQGPKKKAWVKPQVQSQLGWGPQGHLIRLTRLTSWPRADSATLTKNAQKSESAFLAWLYVKHWKTTV